MKKLLLAGPIALVALAAGPLAAAQAADNTFDGTCMIMGTAKFTKPLKGGQPEANGYDFTSTKDKSSCEGKLNGVAVTKAPIDAYVKGEGMLSCEAAQSTSPGVGAVVFNNGTATTADDVPIAATLEFVGAVSEVALDIKGKKAGQARGRASFLTSAGPDTATRCGPMGEGIPEIGFEALFRTTSPLVAEAPPKPAPSPTPGPAPGPTPGPPGGGESAFVASLSTKAQRLKNVRKKGIAVTCASSEPATFSLVAQISAAVAKRLGLRASSSAKKPVVVGRGKVSVPGAGARKVTAFIKLTKAGRRALAKAKSLRVRIVGKVTGVTRRTQNVAATAKLKR